MTGTIKPFFGRLLFNDKPIGSGFLCYRDNFVATCYHVIKDVFGQVEAGQEVVFECLPSGRQIPARITPLQDIENDIVVLELTRPADDVMAPQLAETTQIPPHTPFSTMGYGYFETNANQHTYVSATGTIVGWTGFENRNLIQVKSSDLLNGLSGAPIYVEDYGIVGVLLGRDDSDPSKPSFGEHLGYVIPIHHLIALLERTVRPEFARSGIGVFISYKSDDRKTVREYYDALQLRGVSRLWMDQQALVAGNIWRNEIAEAIATRSVMIVFVTPKALQSEEVKKEYLFAIEKGLLIIPIILKDSTPEDLRVLAPPLADRHILNAIQMGMQAVIEALCDLLPRSPYRWKEDSMCHVPDDGPCILGDPNHQIAELSLDEFWISRTVVTANEYLCFVKADGYNRAEFWSGDTRAQWGRRGGQYIWIQEKFETYANQSPDFPMSRITWYEAMAYSRWFSYMTFHEFTLPDKLQWEKAARGTQGLLYPWGTWKEGVANTKELGKNRILRCGELGSGGNSPYGCQDMAGNVWEWTQSLAATKGADDPRVIKGGSYKQRRGQAYTYLDRHSFPVPESSDVQDAIGFRLVTAKDPSYIRES